MSKLRSIIVLVLCLLSAAVWGQKRLSSSDNRLARVKGFSTRDIENNMDVLLGLHASLYTGSHHLIGLSAEGAWSSFVTPKSITQTSITPGGGSGGLHLLYEYQYSGYLIQLGLGASYQSIRNNIADTVIYHNNMTHVVLPGTYTLKHEFYDRYDVSKQIYLQLPLYFGHYIFGEKGIGYFLAGVRLNYAVWGKTHQSLIGTTTGQFEKYEGIWAENDKYGFRKDVPIERDGERLKLKFDLLAHGEAGYEYNTQQAHNYGGEQIDARIRIAAFADFSMLNISPKTTLPFYEIPEATIYDFPTYHMEHYFATEDSFTPKNAWLRNLFVGVRVTFLFSFVNKDRCILCDPWRH